jgi:hypothetical protein
MSNMNGTGSWRWLCCCAAAAAAAAAVFCEEGAQDPSDGALDTFWRAAENFQTTSTYPWAGGACVWVGGWVFWCVGVGGGVGMGVCVWAGACVTVGAAHCLPVIDGVSSLGRRAVLVGGLCTCGAHMIGFLALSCFPCVVALGFDCGSVQAMA